jgi:UDPglucose 6-dehydrogenase
MKVIPQLRRRVAVLGTGYVGLTFGAFLAGLGHEVCCADITPEKVAMLSRGKIPIVEPGLDLLVREGLANGRLSFVLGASASLAGREFIFLCLPTPALFSVQRRELGEELFPAHPVLRHGTRS